METENKPKQKNRMNLYMAIILVVALIGGGGIFFTSRNPQTKNEIIKKPYEEIVTKNQGSYIVKNMVYTETSLDLTKIEKVMKEIRSGCNKPCKINLYSTREAYDLDIIAGERNFTGFTNEQKNYLATHILAFWGMDEGDNIEFYPSK